MILFIQMQDHVPPGISIAKSDNLDEWQMDIKVLDDNPIYKGHTYRLKFTFSNKYPIGTSLSFLSHSLPIAAKLYGTLANVNALDNRATRGTIY
jgi:hypothetical protein